MKKFITFTLCLLLCVATLGLVGCGKKDKDVVDTSIATKGNGGSVVTRGDYIYFVNGYKSFEVFNKDNLDTNFNVGGLYRVKLNDNNELDYNNQSLSSAEKISGNLVGFENTSLYVFGNTIYYATPITEVDKQGNLQNTKIEFKRMSIGGGKAESVYKASVESANTKFEFYYANGGVYLLVNENGTLNRVECFGKFNVSQVATDVKTVVMPRDTDDVFDSDNYKNIYYTKSNSDGKLEIYNYNVLTNSNQYKKTTDFKTLELLEVKFGHLYFKASGNEQPSYTYFYRVDATENAIRNMAVEKLTSDKDYTNIYLLENETDGFIAQSSNKTYYLSYNAGAESTPIVVDNSKLEIIAMQNGFIYIKSGTDIKRINIHDLRTSGITTQQSIITIEGLEAYTCDIDSNNLYVYATKGSNTYLYSIALSGLIDGETYEQRLLGVYESSDAPAVED